jgi:biotin transporter BioY
MIMLFKKAVIFFFIIIFLLAAFLLSKYFQKIIRPKESFTRLLLFMLGCLALMFVLSFAMVFIIVRLFPGELIK